MGLVYTDVRARRCPGCGDEYIPRRGDGGYCKDSCWVRSRGRGTAQNVRLGEALARTSTRHESRVAARHEVDAMLAEAALRSDVRAYRRQRGEVLDLIGRLRSGQRQPGAAPVRRSGDGEAPCCADCVSAGVRDEAESREIHRMIPAGAR